jgi:predicted lipoprotein with Yx(FWY)xxD motif
VLAPIAGPGVDKHLLKTVARNDVIPGKLVHQVTYAGQPLYFFFQDESPGETDGANLFDNVVDPTGVWYLDGANGGRVAPGTARLQSEGPLVERGSGTSPTLSSPVYTFSKDSGDASACTGE